MNFLSRMLAGWTDLFGNKPEGWTGVDYDWVNSLFSAMSIVLWIAMGIVGAAGAIYAIYLGIQLARADEQGKRDEAKKHLITVLIAVASTIALVLFFNLIMPLIVQAFLGKKSVYEYDDFTKTQTSITAVANVARTLFRV